MKIHNNKKTCLHPFFLTTNSRTNEQTKEVNIRVTVGFPAKIRHCANAIFGYYQFGNDSEPIEKPKHGNSSNFHSFPELNGILKDNHLKSDDGDKAAVKSFIKNRSAEFFVDGMKKICYSSKMYQC